MIHGVRQQGLFIFFGFGALSALVFYGVYSITLAGNHVFAEALALPGAFALSGAMQAVTGVRFSDWSSRWNALAGWQRGVIGGVTAIFAFALMTVSMIGFAAFSGWI
jgi:hypothetical protein